MNYVVEEFKSFGSLVGYNFKFDKVSIRLYIDNKYNTLNLYVSKIEGYKRKDICLTSYLYIIIEYINNNQLLNRDGKDILNTSNIKDIEITGLKINKKDMDFINDNFKNISFFNTRCCTLYKDINLGACKALYKDNNSDIYSMDIFNGYSGYLIELNSSHIKRGPVKPLMLGCSILKMSDIDINYELFFLRTKSDTLRKLDIYNKKGLTDKDLLFLGFNNLESISINAYVSSYKSISRLEYLREVYNMIIEDNKGEIVRVNRYLNLLNKLAINRNDKVKLMDMIKDDNAKEFIETLPLDRKKLCKERKEFSLKDSLYGLVFDKEEEKDEIYELRDSNPFSDTNIKYYTLNRRIQ